MPTVGFSTGAIALGDFERGLRVLEDTRADAVELSGLRYSELPNLLAMLPLRLQEIRKRYGYISVHAPTDHSDEERLLDQLAQVAEMKCNIVVHPDTIRQTSLWRTLGTCLCLENLDSRRRTGRTAKELRPFFEQIPDAQLCFDIAHAREVDPTMTVAEGILSEFGGRLAQVHMSEVNGKGKHYAISFGAERAYETFSARLSRVPVILESMVTEENVEAKIRKARMLLDPVRRAGANLYSAASDISYVGHLRAG
jgi:hypothetical protein